MPGMLRSLRSFSTADEGPIAIGPLKDKVFGVLVSAATFHEDHVLLLQRSEDQKFMPGAWSIPAGKIQPGEESLEQAALRELGEEAGIGGKVLGTTGMVWFESVYYGQPLHHIQFNFVLRTDTPDVELRDGSNMNYLWLPVHHADAPPVELDGFTSSLLNRAIDHYQRVR